MTEAERNLMARRVAMWCLLFVVLMCALFVLGVTAADAPTVSTVGR